MINEYFRGSSRVKMFALAYAEYANTQFCVILYFSLLLVQVDINARENK